MYHFRKLDDDLFLIGTGRLLIPKTRKLQTTDYGLYRAAFRGALLTLFGEPTTMSSVADEACDYRLEATDATGHTWLITAYEGPSGPAIGGNSRDHSIYPVAIALLDLIETTEPTDFAATIYDDDTDNTVMYGCTQKTCYYREVRGYHL